MASWADSSPLSASSIRALRLLFPSSLLHQSELIQYTQNAGKAMLIIGLATSVARANGRRILTA